jgi:tetratricopeptide (TPR) repeat protein
MNSSLAHSHIEQGLAHHREGAFEQASNCYQRALQAQPRSPDALHLLGMTEGALGDVQSGIARIREALSIEPHFPAAWFNLGNLLQRSGELPDAIEALRRAVHQQPDSSDFLCNLGNCLLLSGLPEESAETFERALRIAPKSAILHHNLGRARKAMGLLSQAAESMAQAIDLAPDFPKAWEDIAEILRSLERFSDSIQAFLQALQFHPENPALWCNLGECYFEAGHIQEAEECLSNALTLNPKSVPALCNLGNVHRHESRFEQAVAAYQQALLYDPLCNEALGNAGCALLTLGRFQEAENAFRRVLALCPEHPSAQWNLAVTLLSKGDFEHAWPAYESRWQMAHMAPDLRHCPQPTWLGDSPIAGKSLLIHAEQGYGDTLQFVRYVAALAELGAQVHLEVQTPLQPLVENFPGTASVLSRGEPPPPFDFHIPLLSLPLALSNLRSTPVQRPLTPASPPYISPDRAILDRWHARIQPYTGRRIGLAWAGNPRFQNDHHRSLSLTALLPLLSVENHHFFQLQKDVREADLPLISTLPNLINLSDEFSDFAQTSGLIAQLDLVIACDTAVAHLAGAMGKPTWILLPFNSDWRWKREGESTEWYPSATLFRQDTPGNWDSVIERVRKTLNSAAAGS